MFSAFSRENDGDLARAPFALNKMSDDPQTGVVTYREGSQETTFGPLEFILLLQRHIPNKGEILVRYYGWYANASRGKRKPDHGEDDDDASEITVDDDCPGKKECRKRWAAMIRKIYDKDPLICPRCGSEMRIIAFIDQWETVLRILKHLKLWPAPARSPPRHPECSEAHSQQQSIVIDSDFFGP